MSSMRSASSSTTYSTWLSTAFLASMWSSRRPGVATSTSTPRLSSSSAASCPCRQTPRRCAAGCIWRRLDLPRPPGRPARAWAAAPARAPGGAPATMLFSCLPAGAAAAAARTRRSCRCRSGRRPSRPGPAAPPGWPAPGSASWTRSPCRPRRFASGCQLQLAKESMREGVTGSVIYTCAIVGPEGLFWAPGRVVPGVRASRHYPPIAEKPWQKAGAARVR
jgi:hypothetical protein